MRQPSTSARRVHAQRRRAFVLALRQTGASYEAIAHAVHRHFRGEVSPGFDKRSAHRDIRRAMQQVQTELEEAVEIVRHLELARLDELQLSIWPLARAGNLDAINTILRLMARRSTLLGLDTPLKYARTTPTGQPVTPASQGNEAITLEELAALLAAHQSPQEPQDD
jgi:hypothetical protein